MRYGDHRVDFFEGCEIALRGSPGCSDCESGREQVEPKRSEPQDWQRDATSPRLQRPRVYLESRLTAVIRGTRGRSGERKLIGDRAEETVEVVQNHEGGTGSVALGGQRPRPGNRLE